MGVACNSKYESVAWVIDKAYQTHSEKKEALSAKSDEMQQEIILITNKLTLAQSLRANAEFQLKERHTIPATLTPMTSAPTPSKSSMTAKPSGPSPKYLTDSYREMLLLMRPSPTQRALDWLKQSLSVDADSPKELKALVNQLKPGKPIPPTLMNQLLARRDLGRLWISPNKPDVEILDKTTPYTPSSSLRLKQ